MLPPTVEAGTQGLKFSKVEATAGEAPTAWPNVSVLLLPTVATVAVEASAAVAVAVIEKPQIKVVLPATPGRVAVVAAVVPAPVAVTAKVWFVHWPGKGCARAALPTKRAAKAAPIARYRAMIRFMSATDSEKCERLGTGRAAAAPGRENIGSDQ